MPRPKAPKKTYRHELRTMIDLRALAAEHGYRVTRDESAIQPDQTEAERAWLWQLDGKTGHVFVHGVNRLGAYCRAPAVFSRLLAIPGVEPHKRGDRELSVTFPPESLVAVATVLRCRRRRRLSDEQRSRLIESGSIHRFPARRGTDGLEDAPCDAQAEQVDSGTAD